jgi:hypothetical protein
MFKYCYTVYGMRGIINLTPDINVVLVSYKGLLEVIAKGTAQHSM